MLTENEVTLHYGSAISNPTHAQHYATNQPVQHLHADTSSQPMHTEPDLHQAQQHRHESQQDDGAPPEHTRQDGLQSVQEDAVVSQDLPPQATIVNQVPPLNPLYYWIGPGNYPETVSRALHQRGNWVLCKEDEAIEKCHFLWKPFNFNQAGYSRIDRRIVRNPNIFVYNHFEKIGGLTTKTGLIRSLKQYYFTNPQARAECYSCFDSTPTTFLIPQTMDDPETLEFYARYRDIAKGFAPRERIPMKHCVNNIWLVKPAAMNQGRGIEIFSDLNDIMHFISKRAPNSVWVVQKYIERPLLFKGGRKFDIRVWNLVTYKNDVYFYKYGYLRTSSDSYSLNNGNNYVHLTNNCLQKHGDNYGKHEDGNTVGFEAFQQYLDEVYPQHGLSVYEHFVPRMKDLIIDSFLAAKTQLNPNRRKNCFELFGFDFLVDEDFRIWLIEINTNPYFGVPNEYIDKLLPKMMDDLMELVLEPVYPAEHKIPKTANQFELIYSEGAKGDYFLNQRRPFSCSVYPVRELRPDMGKKTQKFDSKIIKQYKINANLSTVRPQTAQHQSTGGPAAPHHNNNSNNQNIGHNNNNNSKEFSSSTNNNMSLKTKITQQLTMKVPTNDSYANRQKLRSTSVNQKDSVKGLQTHIGFTNNTGKHDINNLKERSVSKTQLKTMAQSTVTVSTKDKTTTYSQMHKHAAIGQAKTEVHVSSKAQYLVQNIQNTSINAAASQTIQSQGQSSIQQSTSQIPAHNQYSVLHKQSKPKAQNTALTTKLRDILNQTNKVGNPKNLRCREFDEVFQQVASYVIENSLLSSTQSCELLNMILRSDSLVLLQREKQLLILLDLINQDCVSTKVKLIVADILLINSYKLQVKQVLITNKLLSCLVQVTLKQNNQIDLMKKLIKILISVSCLEYDTTKFKHKKLPGINIINEMLQTEAFEIGLVSFLQTLHLRHRAKYQSELIQVIDPYLLKKLNIIFQINLLKKIVSVQEQKQHNAKSIQAKVPPAGETLSVGQNLVTEYEGDAIKSQFADLDDAESAYNKHAVSIDQAKIQLKDYIKDYRKLEDVDDITGGHAAAASLDYEHHTYKQHRSSPFKRGKSQALVNASEIEQKQRRRKSIGGASNSFVPLMQAGSLFNEVILGSIDVQELLEFNQSLLRRANNSQERYDFNNNNNGKNLSSGSDMESISSDQEQTNSKLQPHVQITNQCSLNQKNIINMAAATSQVLLKQKDNSIIIGAQDQKPHIVQQNPEQKQHHPQILDQLQYNSGSSRGQNISSYLAYTNKQPSQTITPRQHQQQPVNAKAGAGFISLNKTDHQAQQLGKNQTAILGNYFSSPDKDHDASNAPVAVGEAQAPMTPGTYKNSTSSRIKFVPILQKGAGAPLPSTAPQVSTSNQKGTPQLASSKTQKMQGTSQSPFIKNNIMTGNRNQAMQQQPANKVRQTSQQKTDVRTQPRNQYYLQQTAIINNHNNNNAAREEGVMEQTQKFTPRLHQHNQYSKLEEAITNNHNKAQMLQSHDQARNVNSNNNVVGQGSNGILGRQILDRKDHVTVNNHMQQIQRHSQIQDSSAGNNDLIQKASSPFKKANERTNSITGINHPQQQTITPILSGHGGSHISQKYDNNIDVFPTVKSLYMGSPDKIVEGRNTQKLVAMGAQAKLV